MAEWIDHLLPLKTWIQIRVRSNENLKLALTAFLLDVLH